MWLTLFWTLINSLSPFSIVVENPAPSPSAEHQASMAPSRLQDTPGTEMPRLGYSIVTAKGGNRKELTGLRGFYNQSFNKNLRASIQFELSPSEREAGEFSNCSVTYFSGLDFSSSLNLSHHCYCLQLSGSIPGSEFEFISAQRQFSRWECPLKSDWILFSWRYGFEVFVVMR